ncbi:MAG: 50S ribosomal protein L20 [Chlamydiia bacterium]|nr:50S ribosomal protein L20 [Chlamydiia bacterium]
MTRITCAPARKKKRNRLFKQVKGFRGRRKNTVSVARSAVMKAMAYQYIHRRVRKRDFRSLWIQRINAAARAEGMSYSRLIDGLNKAGVKLNRKSLAELAVNEPKAFSAVCEKAKSALA